MKRVVLLVFVFLFLHTHFSRSEEVLDPIENTVNEETFVNEETPVNMEVVENQQMNQDEGYGAEDEEYYGSEGNSVEENVTK